MSDSERRKSERIMQHGHAEVRMVNEEKPRECVQIMNISEGGIRFVASMAFDIGELCMLRIGQEEHKARVHHCKQLFKGFAVRAEFVAESG